METEAAILTAAIITRAAEGKAADVHMRMPAILPKDANPLGDRGQTDGKRAFERAQQVCVVEELKYHAVSHARKQCKEHGDGFDRAVSKSG